MFLSLGGSRRSKERNNHNNSSSSNNNITTTHSHGCSALNQAGVDSSSRVALPDTLQNSTGIGSSVPPLAPPSPDATSSYLSLDPLQSLAGTRSRYAPFSKLGASPLPPYYYTHDLAVSQNYPSFQSPDPLSSLYGNNLLQPSFNSASPSSFLVVPSFVSSSSGTSSPGVVEGSSLCGGDCSPGQNNSFAVHKLRVLQPSARRSQTLDLAKKLKDSLGTKFADSLRETLEGVVKHEPRGPEFSDEGSLLRSDATTTWKTHPHSLEDGSSSRSESTGGFSGRESRDSCAHWGVESISVNRAITNPNSSPNPRIATGSTRVFPEAIIPSVGQHPRSSFEFSDAEVSPWLGSQPQPQPSLVAVPQVAHDFTSSAAHHGPILSELSPQTYVWPQERHHTSTATTLPQTFPFENSPLVHATRNNNVEDLLRPASDSGSFPEIMNCGGQSGGVKRFLCDDGGDVGVNMSKRQKLCASGFEERADGTSGLLSGAVFGFDQYLAALAATEQVPSYELVPSPHHLGASSPISKFLEHFDRHESEQL